MRVEKFTKEIVSIDEMLVAISSISAIGPIYLIGTRGYGPQYYSFQIKTALGNNGSVEILSYDIPYGHIAKSIAYNTEEDYPEYLDKKIELAVVRDELVEIWSNYLEQNK